MAAKTEKTKSSGSAGSAKADKGFTAEERAAIKERAREVLTTPAAKKADGEEDLLARIAEMPDADRILAERLHAIVKTAAPTLSAKTWYGMPTYARDGNVICFFQSSHKFKTRYSTLGFSDKASLDEGDLWPVAFALRKLTAEEEARITALIKKAVG